MNIKLDLGFRRRSSRSTSSSTGPAGPRARLAALLSVALAASIGCGENAAGPSVGGAGGAGGAGGGASQPGTGGAIATGGATATGGIGGSAGSGVAGAAATGGAASAVGGRNGTIIGENGGATESPATGTGGASGAGGLGAQGGAGGATMGPGGTGDGAPAIPPALSCDDGNPCTADLATDIMCQHAPVADGTACDDGDLCTLGDRCLAGLCAAGTRSHQAGAILGSVRSFGTGLGYGMSSDRFFFVDLPDYGRTLHLTMAQVKSNALTATANMDVDLGFNRPLATAWDDLMVVTDNDTSTIFGNAPPRMVQVFSTSAAGDLVRRGQVGIGDSFIPALTSMAGRKNNLWICANLSFFGSASGVVYWIDVTDPDAPKILATGAPGGQCGSVAASEDATRLYVNTSMGVRWADLSGGPAADGTFAFKTDPLIPEDSGLAVRGGRLLTRGTGLIRLWDEATHALLASIDTPDAHTAALTDVGVVVQSDRAPDGVTSLYLSLYSFAGTLIGERDVLDYSYKYDIASARAIAGGRYAMDTITHQLFALSGDGLAPAEAPGIGSLRNLYAIGDHVAVRGATNAQLLDVGNAYNPTIVTGGPHRHATLGLKLDDTFSPPVLVPEIEGTVGSFYPAPAGVGVVLSAHHPSSTPLERIVFDDKYREQTVPGTTPVALPGGAANLVAAGDFLYRGALADGHAVLQRWSFADLYRGAFAPSATVVVDAPTNITSSAPSSVLIDVDPRARTAAVGIPGSGGVLHVIDLAANPPAIVDTQPGPWTMQALRIHGSYMAYIDYNTLVFRDRGSPDEVIFESETSSFQTLLAYDGNTAYVGTSYGLETFPRTTVGGALVPGWSMPMSSPPMSLTATDHALMIGSATAAIALRPACP